jgi:ComF family protein
MRKGRILTDFISLFYPRICIYCKRVLISKEEFLCLHCRLTLPTTGIHKNANDGLFKRLMVITNLHEVHSYLNFNKGGIAQKILHEIKYKGQQELGKSIGEWFGYHILDKIKESNIDLIVPIPLHVAKRKRRGYNQSELIALGLSNSLDIPCEPNLLIRTKHTSTQTKKGKTERWLNVENIFALNTRNIDIENKHILLVDDVITTGATIESAGYMLNRNGIAKISVACIASGRQ